LLPRSVWIQRHKFSISRHAKLSPSHKALAKIALHMFRAASLNFAAEYETGPTVQLSRPRPHSRKPTGEQAFRAFPALFRVLRRGGNMQRNRIGFVESYDQPAA
jgi:hypothetical protein